MLLEPGGALFTFSCSGGIDADLFHKIVAGAGIDAGVDGFIHARLGAAPDHPMTMTFPEGEYLKGLVLAQALRAAAGRSRVSNLARRTLKNALTLRTFASCVKSRCDQRVVAGHVGDLDDEHEVGAGRDAMALLHRGLGDGARLERVERLGDLAVERDLDDRRQAVAERLGREQGDAALDDAARRPARLTRRRHVAGEIWTRAASAWLVSEASVCSRSRILQIGGVEIGMSKNDS